MKCCSLICVSAIALVSVAGLTAALRADPQDDLKKKLEEAKKEGQKQLEKLTGKDGKPADGHGMPGGMQMDPQMQKCMEIGQPTEVHAHMAKMAGTWNADCKMWMDPAQPPMQTKGVMTCTVKHDGRWVFGDYKSDFMGQPFTGTMIMGYNVADKKCESIWCDSMSTGMMMSKGTISEDGKTHKSTCEFTGPDKAGNLVAVKEREVVTFVDDNKFVMEMFMTYPNQPEAKMMEITYTRDGAAKADAPAHAPAHVPAMKMPEMPKAPKAPEMPKAPAVIK